MIVVLMFVSLVMWSAWLMRRTTRAAQAAPSPTASPSSSPSPSPSPKAPVALALGLEDDPVHWPAPGSPWTALDERQLIRLLRDSAP